MAVCPVCSQVGDLGAPCTTHTGLRLVDELQLEKYRNAHGVMLGKLLAGRFALVRVLGKGGMGWVYEAIQEPIGRRVAIKVLRSDHSSDAIVRERFEREAKALGKLQHPNLVVLFDYGRVDVPADPTTGAEAEELIFFAMEMLRGQTLADVLASPRFLAATRLLDIARGIAAGLAEAHRNQVVHRDLKPENVLLVRDSAAREVVKLVDFGIARLSGEGTLTQTGMVFGTPAYMSPEQCVGEREVGTAADSYAFGVLLYRMLADRLPFEGEKPLQLLMAHVNRPVPPIVLRPGLSAPQSLLDLTLRCLAKQPAERPADGRALLEALEQATADLQQGHAIVHGAAEPGGSAPDATAPGRVVAMARAEADAVAAELDAAGHDAAQHETIVLGGGVQLADDAAVASTWDDATSDEVLDTFETLPAQIASQRSQEDIPTLVSLEGAGSERGLKEAYRVAPRADSPSALRGATQGRSKLPMIGLAAGAVILLGGGIGAGLMLGGGNDPAGSEQADAATKPESGESAPDEASEEGDGLERRATPTPDTAPDTDALGAMSARELRDRLAQLRKALETARETAISEDHRVEIELGYWEQMKPVIDELERRGLQP